MWEAWQANKTKAANITYLCRVRDGTGIVDGVSESQINWNTYPSADSGEGGFSRVFRGPTGTAGPFLKARFENLLTTDQLFDPTDPP